LKTTPLTGSAADGQQELRMALHSFAELVVLRRQLRQLLGAKHAAAAEREAIVLATEEAANNALLACERLDCQVDVAVSFLADYICIEVRDAGVGSKGACVNLAQPADDSAEHGRGLYLMQELMESLELVPRPQGTLVRMTKRLR
jgi:anti-sigma regulatory factor (Ser/Thr protein kinase)